MEVFIGEFDSKDAALRAAIRRLAVEVDRCPDAEEYHIVWAGPDPDQNQRVDRRALWYFRRPKTLGYEHDVSSGIAGRNYIVDDAAIKAVAEKGGALEDFAEYDNSQR